MAALSSYAFCSKAAAMVIGPTPKETGSRSEEAFFKIDT
jgi:hypothetical protein